MVKNRKGTSHVEIILSVVIFLAFVGIALYFFSPKNTDRVIGTTQEYAFREIEKQASVVLETYGVNLNQIGPIGVGIDEIGGGGVRVENSAENVLSSGRTGEIVCINGGGNEFVYIYVSEDFSSSGCGLSNGDYTLASSNSRKVVSEKKLKLLQSKYNSDYSGLKEEFNLPGRVEFGFEFNFDDGGEISAIANIPENLEVFSKSKRVEILREEGTREFGELKVTIW